MEIHGRTGAGAPRGLLLPRHDTSRLHLNAGGCFKVRTTDFHPWLGGSCLASTTQIRAMSFLKMLYYGHYGYLPLYIVAGDQLLCARLRPANIDAAEGALEEVRRIAEQLRRVWPDVEILLRAGSGFCRDQIMSWCENQGVD